MSDILVLAFQLFTSTSSNHALEKVISHVVKKNTRKDQQKQAANKKKRSLKQKQARAQYASEQAKVSASQRSKSEFTPARVGSDKLLTGERTLNRNLVADMTDHFLEAVQNEVTKVAEDWSHIAFLLEISNIYNDSGNVHVNLNCYVGYRTLTNAIFTLFDHANENIRAAGSQLIQDSFTAYTDIGYEPPRAFIGVLTKFGPAIAPVFVSERDAVSGGYDKWRNDIGFSQPGIFNEIFRQLQSGLSDPLNVIEPYTRRIHRIVAKSDKVKNYNKDRYTVFVGHCSDGKVHAFSSIDGLITDWIESQIIDIYEDALRVVPSFDEKAPMSGVYVVMETDTIDRRGVILSAAKIEDQNVNEMERKLQEFTPPKF